MESSPQPLQVALWGDGLQVVFRDGQRVNMSRQQVICLFALTDRRRGFRLKAARRSVTRSQRRLRSHGLIDKSGKLTRRGRSLVSWLAQTRRRDLRMLRELTRPN